MNRRPNMHKLKKTLIVYLMLCTIGLSSCGEIENTSADLADTVTERFWANYYHAVDEQQIFTLENTEDGVNRFCYYVDGVLNNEKIMENIYEGCYYDEDQEVLFSYNRDKQQIEILNRDFILNGILVSDLQLFEIKNMVKLDNILYILVVENNPYETNIALWCNEEDGYMDFGEQIYAIDLKTGQKNIVDIDNPICISFLSNGELLIYAYQQGDYRLLTYDAEKEGATTVRTMNNIGYAYAFVCIENYFFYTGYNHLGVWKMNMETGDVVCLDEEMVIIKGADLQIIENKVMALDHYYGMINRFSIAE